MMAVEGHAKASGFDAGGTRPRLEHKVMDRGLPRSAVNDADTGVDLAALRLEVELGAHLLVRRDVGIWSAKDAISRPPGERCWTAACTATTVTTI